MMNITRLESESSGINIYGGDCIVSYVVKFKKE
jgi:hypothetical protein